jgi:hypothetical protein
MSRHETSDISTRTEVFFSFNENVENQELPRFGHFVKRNGPDPGATQMRNVFLVISVLSILSQLPCGAFVEGGPVFPIFFLK